MLRQLKEMQMRLALAEERDRQNLRTDLSQYSDCAEGICGTGDKPSEGREAASMGVSFTAIASVSDCNLLSPTTNTHIDTPIWHGNHSLSKYLDNPAQ